MGILIRKHTYLSQLFQKTIFRSPWVLHPQIFTHASEYQVLPAHTPPGMGVFPYNFLSKWGEELVLNVAFEPQDLWS